MPKKKAAKPPPATDLRSEREIRSYLSDLKARTSKLCKDPDCINCRIEEVVRETMAWVAGEVVPRVEGHIEWAAMNK